MRMWPPNARLRAARRLLRLAVAALCLSACGSPPRGSFDLSGGVHDAAARAAVGHAGAALAVNEPEASPPLHPERIVIRIAPGEIAYLADAQWADRLTRLVQARLVSAFGRGGVAATLPGAPVAATLSTIIHRFEIDLTQQTAVVEIAARILDHRTGRERAAHVFRGEAPAPHTYGAAAVQSLEMALDDASRQLVGWARGRI
jgi:cholesterol transport system auxiliary component